MTRNREIALFFGVVLGGTAVFCLLARPVAPLAVLPVLGLASFLGSVFFIFTRWRYKQIEKRCAYLARVYADGPSPDIRDNREGELSILKNDIYKLTVTLREQADLLAAALGDISHQIKTPLTSLLVLTDLLADPALPPETRDTFLSQVSAQLTRIQWLVASLLELSRMDAGVVAFKKEPVSLRKLAQDALCALAVPLEVKNITASVRCPGALLWQGDEGWTREALTNVLKNCAEHTPPGGALTVTCAENALHTSITVEDSGPGIPPEDLPHLFERFYRGKNAGQGSVGIGLSLAKAILQNQNGDITAENTGCGARFTIYLYRLPV